MSLKPFAVIIKALCVSLCLASSSSSSEDVARDFIDHVLRIRDPEKVLNSVLGRLEQNRQQGLMRPSNDATDCEEPSEILPEYTESLQASRERDLRQLGPQVRKAAYKSIHYPICHLERKIRKLNTKEYEYQPAYYEEVRCTMASSEDIGVTNEICSSLGFSCVQWNKTIHLTRRRYSSDCWETRTMVIPAGCECMWPVHRLGDMNLHV